MKPDAVVAWFTQAAMWVTGVMLGGRFVLRLLNANATNDFVDWVYDQTQPILTPFLREMPTVRVGDGFNVEIATLFAIVVYLFAGFLVMAVIGTYARRANNAVPKRSIGLVLRSREKA